jgi:hypothetical protein
MKPFTKQLLPFFIAGIAILGFKDAAAQQPAINTGNYRTAIGMRVGHTSGLTVKHFMGNGNAIEGIIGVWPSAFSITGMYQWHVAAPSAPGLKWYYGIGAHATFYNDRYYYYREGRRGYWYRYYRYQEGGAGIGIDGTLGLEYKIPPIPFALSFDIKPYVEFTTHNHVFMAFDPGLGIKFTF